MGNYNSVKTNTLLFLLVLCFLQSMGCSRHYWHSRKSDVLDIVKFDIGTSLGVSGRVGLIGIGLNGIDIRNRHGDGGSINTLIWPLSRGQVMDAPIPYMLIRDYTFGRTIEYRDRKRGKAYEARLILPFYYHLDDDYKKSQAYGTVFPFTFYSQVEVCVGLYKGFRLIVNPGEALDFILGWTCLDFYGDDKYFYSGEYEKDQKLKALSALYKRNETYIQSLMYMIANEIEAKNITPRTNLKKFLSKNQFDYIRFNYSPRIKFMRDSNGNLINHLGNTIVITIQWGEKLATIANERTAGGGTRLREVVLPK